MPPLYVLFSFVPNGVPLGGGGEGNFVPPLMLKGLLEAYLLSDPFPPFFGQVIRSICFLRNSNQV